MRSQLRETSVEQQPAGCEACAASRELELLYLEALDLHPGDSGYGEAEAALLHARRVLHAKCTCGQEPFDLRAKCRELGCRPRPVN